MKKLALRVVVAGVFLAGCGGNLPKEITSHENYKNCQEVEKNLLTIQSSFEKDERVNYYNECNQYYKEFYFHAINKDEVASFKEYADKNYGGYKFQPIHDLAGYFIRNLVKPTK